MGARDPSAAASSLFVLTTSRGRKRARLSNEAADDDSGVSNMPNIFPFGLLNSDKERFVSVLICLLSRFSKFNCCVRREESSLRKLNFEMRKKYHEVEQIEPKAFKKVFVVAKKNEKGTKTIFIIKGFIDYIRPIFGIPRAVKIFMPNWKLF